jgi:ABC-type uncharacterized transport system involved in gliding motility auxiliary subunit
MADSRADALAAVLAFLLVALPALGLLLALMAWRRR